MLITIYNHDAVKVPIPSSINSVIGFIWSCLYHYMVYMELLEPLETKNSNQIMYKYCSIASLDLWSCH